MTFRNGVASFTLKHGESKTAADLPAGVRYTVTESDNSGYRVKSTNATGKIKANTTVQVSFENIKSTVPKTGDENSGTLWVWLMAAAVIGMSAVAVPVVKKKRQ